MKPLVLALALLSAVDSLDVRIHREVQRARTPVAEGVMRGASNVRQNVVLGALLCIAVFDRVHGVAVARQALIALIPTNVTVEAIKRATHRARPDGSRDPSNSSFPSSHAANAVALAAVLARRWRRLAPLLWASAALVAVSRMYLNRHFASDVLVGAAMGAAFGALAARWAPLTARPAASEQEVRPSAA